METEYLMICVKWASNLASFVAAFCALCTQARQGANSAAPNLGSPFLGLFSCPLPLAQPKENYLELRRGVGVLAALLQQLRHRLAPGIRLLLSL